MRLRIIIKWKLIGFWNILVINYPNRINLPSPHPKWRLFSLLLIHFFATGSVLRADLFYWGGLYKRFENIVLVWTSNPSLTLKSILTIFVSSWKWRALCQKDLGFSSNIFFSSPPWSGLPFPFHPGPWRHDPAFVDTVANLSCPFHTSNGPEISPGLHGLGNICLDWPAITKF